MIRITKLHLILLGVIVLIAGIYFYQVQQENQRQAELAAIEAEREVERKRFEDEKRRQELLEKKRQLSVEAVAVAGEYMMLAKKEGKDVAAGQQTLRHAKEDLAQNNLDEAYRRAHQSIAQFKAAPSLTLFYTVRRGDCLWDIAKMPRHYNRGSEWVRIWRANRKKIPDFDLIIPRQVLLIPKKK